MKDVALIVDDSLTVRMDLADAFAAAGFEPVPCGCLAEARAATARTPIAVVVLDVQLPDGDGVEYLAELRATPALQAVSVMMLSTFAEIADRARGLRTGADEYVGKPYDAGYIVARARELVRARRGERHGAAPTVLVIDDSPTFRAELIGALETAGYQVIAAVDGESGLRIAADRRPDAIIVDGVLPGIDGPAVIRRVRLDAALRSVPCALLTGSGDRVSELRALDAGADAFVRKDEDLDVILARVAVLLRKTLDRSTALPSLGPRKILAVDDSSTYLESIGDALREEGYDVVQARSGEQALELLGIQPVDCILLDLVMPGIGGQETCRRIKAAPVLRDIPLIMLTALEDRGALISGLAAGADDFIAKSSDLAVVNARVRAQLRRKQFEDENRRILGELLAAELDAAEARATRELAAQQARMVEELARKNRELEAFTYSVSHDMRSPLRGILGFCRALEEDSGRLLDDVGREHLGRVVANAKRMNELIDDMLALSRISRAELHRTRVDVSAVAREIVAELRRRDPERVVDTMVEDGLIIDGDGRLIKIVLENLIGNAWKFTGKTDGARIVIVAAAGPHAGAICVRDNGAGFDPALARDMFLPFRRLHSAKDYEGTGIGLATVHRIVDRHGGRVWAEGVPGAGATFYFTLGSARARTITS